MNKWVVLDRDGVINRIARGEYVTSQGQVQLLPGAAEAIGLLNRKGYSVAVVSNQQCVALGMLSLEGLDAVSEAVRAGVRVGGGEIAGFFYCTHLKDAGCACRKPRPGLLLEAQTRYGFTLADTYFVGDMYADLLMAKNAGCRAIFALGGLDEELYRAGTPFPHAPEHVAGDLLEAVAYILSRADIA